jgi:tRNA nucleotidyltransferase/poly(A) polymerase
MNKNNRKLLQNFINEIIDEILSEEVIRKKFDISLPKDLVIIANLFKKLNKEFYLVGGSVRDALMNKKPKDFDLVTNALPDEVIKLFKNHPQYTVIEVGKAFGVIKVVTPEKNEYEIATFRQDLSGGRRPDAVSFTTIDQDVSRRDLTMNALFYDIENKEIVDYVGGIQDIEKGTVKTVGVAKERFNEDRLRILRALRFAARFGNGLEEKTEEAIKQDNSLEGVSPERIRDEFLKGIKSAKNVSYFFNLISEFNLWSQIFPNLIVSMNFKETKNIPVQLALLLLDNKDIKKTGKILNGLKYTSDEVSQITFLLELRNLNFDNVVKIKRMQKNSKLSKNDLLEFGMLTNDIEPRLLNAFLDFNLSVSGDDLVKLGFKGENLGKELEVREKKKFLNLYQGI